ncbi:IS66-like element accessory protein TnpA [Sphingobium sp. MK2]|uniref:IS66-like element accessory protein TnpA n=1 Tax=Sphingobium sp. MK2 TaxID=3116540 RepID=UPI0032E35FE8
MSQVTVISGVERRREWSVEQKLALVAAASAPGASVAEVARRADLRASQIYRWRRDLRSASKPEQAFAPVLVSPDHDHRVATSPALVIELRGVVVKIAQDASPALVTATLRALRR